MDKVRLFVYGILKSDGPLYCPERVFSVKKAKIRGWLYQLDGQFPFLDAYGDGLVYGEVHEIEEMSLYYFDKLERCYERIQTKTLDREVVFVYHYPYINDSYKRIPYGWWNNHGRNNGWEVIKDD